MRLPGPPPLCCPPAYSPIPSSPPIAGSRTTRTTAPLAAQAGAPRPTTSSCRCGRAGAGGGRGGRRCGQHECGGQQGWGPQWPASHPTPYYLLLLLLLQVRGKDFRHEKTKKKRGSYRGGLIDTNANNSFKFEDPDA